MELAAIFRRHLERRSDRCWLRRVPAHDVAFRTALGGKRSGADPAVYECTIHPDWWVVRGPHGGYLMSMILRAMTDLVDDSDRAIRSMTIHFVAPPGEGPMQIEVRVERRGRSLTSVSARAQQEGNVVALALAAFSMPWTGLDHDAAPMPPVPSPDEGMVVPIEGAFIPPFLGNFDLRAVIGDAPFSGSDRAELGAWMRFRDPTLVDAPAIACMMDALAPTLFPVATELIVCPTIDMTVHFRARFPMRDAVSDDFYLGRFYTSLARDGFFEENGELWAGDGTLIAQSRQLGLIIKP